MSMSRPVRPFRICLRHQNVVEIRAQKKRRKKKKKKKKKKKEEEEEEEIILTMHVPVTKEIMTRYRYDISHNFELQH